MSSSFFKNDILTYKRKTYYKSQILIKNRSLVKIQIKFFFRTLNNFRNKFIKQFAISTDRFFNTSMTGISAT